jgi:hypothetical protein
MLLFKKHLINVLGIYATIPSCKAYKVELSLSFNIAEDAFEQMNVPSMKEMLAYELERNGRKFQAELDKAIKEIREFKD